jgi:hypothetical protein
VSTSARTLDCVRADHRVGADAGVRPRGYASVRTDASVLSPGNFITDATVRPSHGRPSGHRPIVRPSICYRPRDNPVMKYAQRNDVVVCDFLVGVKTLQKGLNEMYKEERTTFT